MIYDNEKDFNYNIDYFCLLLELINYNDCIELIIFCFNYALECINVNVCVMFQNVHNVHSLQ